MTPGAPTDLGRVTALAPLPPLDGPAGLKAVVLLSGSVRATDLSRSVGRSLLDLPLAEDETVLSLWQKHVASLSSSLGLGPIPVRVVINRSGLVPATGSGSTAAPIHVEHDKSELRGTGGALRDAAQGYDDSDRILVASGAQVLTERLADVAGLLLAGNHDVSILAHDDGTPSGLFAARCGCLCDIRPAGFVDFKEQVLPRLAASGHSIHAVRRTHASGIPIRTLDGYISALRAHHRLKQGRPVAYDPFEEDWSPTFSLVERGARVDPGATIHDSAVLAGAFVASGAVVVRSVVCPGASVPAGATIADQIVGAQLRERGAPGP